MNDSKKNRWAVIGLNILIMAVVAIIIGWLAMFWLDIWTSHGKEVIVPDVSGMSFEQARNHLLAEGFDVELSDSVYDKKARPGEVVDQNPHKNTSVKPGRLIYLTINAYSPKMVTIPRLTDMSSRQARAILEGLGFTNIREEKVISEFPDLVLGVKSGNRRLVPGARQPLTAVITLEVGDGLTDMTASDSIAAERNDAANERLDLF